jgi:hypothetical protein
MPSIKSHQSTTSTKLLFLGDSGAGKTGALASLAQAGYSLRIMDFDNGLDVLKSFVTDSSSPYVKANPKCADELYYVTLTEEMRHVGGKAVPKKADSWQKALKLLDNWQEKDETGALAVDLGPLRNWGPNDVLVIDSFTGMCNAALNLTLAMNGRLGSKPFQSDWGDAQAQVEQFLELIKDKETKCNVILNCHVTWQGEDNGPQRGYPSALGKALPPKVARYFNTMLMARSDGVGANSRKIFTSSNGQIDMKNTNPLKVLPSYPLATGLADYFKAVRT